MLMQQKEEWRFIRLQKDFAISVTFNPNGSTVLTDLTQDARVDINTNIIDNRFTNDQNRRNLNHSNTSKQMHANVFIAICKYFGTTVYMNLHVIKNGKSIYIATQLSALTCVNAPD